MKTEGGPLFREHGRQVAALCWRVQANLPRVQTPLSENVELLLITSLSSKRWILPKGWPKAHKSLAESAACEAFEEAGVLGDISPAPLGTYHYLKQRKDCGALACSVEVFAMKVTAQSQDWPDKAKRSFLWLPIDQAMAKVAEPGLRQLLRNFGTYRGPTKHYAGW